MTSVFPQKPNLLFVRRPEPRPGDISIGSDAEKGENHSPVQTPTDSEPDTSFLKFSIEQILRPDFGPKPSSVAGLRIPQLQAPKSVPALSPACSEAPSPVKPEEPPCLFPAWVYCTRYSDRPSSGPRCRRAKKQKTEDEKRPRTAFTSEQLSRLKAEFHGNRYLTERRRQDLAKDLGLKESQVKIWFQNKRAKIKKQVGPRHPLAMHLMAQGLYNHTTAVKSDEEDDDMKD